MATGLTDADVKVVCDTTLDTAPFIAMADRLVTEELGSKGLSPDRLEDIRLWLAAHFVAMRDDSLRESARRVANDAQTFAGGTLGESLMFTEWGQQAVALDTTGTLRNLGKPVARITDGITNKW